MKNKSGNKHETGCPEVGGNPQGLRSSCLLSLFQETTKHPQQGGPELQLFRKSSLFDTAAFTLIESLVVVLIIGILAAVAVPQYQKAVEKARMAEAVVLVRAIANAHHIYYLANNEYLTPNELSKLDIQIPGHAANAVVGSARIQTKYFVYAPNGCGASCTDPAQLTGYLALATRVNTENNELYRI